MTPSLSWRAIEIIVQAAIVARRVIQAAIDQGIYVIIDWHTHNIHLDEAKEFFRAMAREFGDQPNIMYEIFNEPDFTNRPDGTTKVDETWLEIKAYAEEVIREIRQYDPDNIINFWDKWAKWTEVGGIYDRHDISWTMWSLGTKHERNSMLQPGASFSGHWDYNKDLTENGRRIRDQLRRMNSEAVRGGE